MSFGDSGLGRLHEGHIGQNTDGSLKIDGNLRISGVDKNIWRENNIATSIIMGLENGPGAELAALATAL